MLRAIISDIHGNLVALEAVLKDCDARRTYLKSCTCGWSRASETFL
jgi:hypothetical protein